MGSSIEPPGKIIVRTSNEREEDAPLDPGGRSAKLIWRPGPEAPRPGNKRAESF